MISVLLEMIPKRVCVYKYAAVTYFRNIVKRIE